MYFIELWGSTAGATKLLFSRERRDSQPSRWYSHLVRLFGTPGHASQLGVTGLRALIREEGSVT